MPFGPVVSSTRLPENEVIRPEDLAIGTSPHTVHGTRLEIHEHSTRDVPPTRGLIVIHIDAFQLQFRVPGVAAGRVDAVLVANHFPEL